MRASLRPPGGAWKRQDRIRSSSIVPLPLTLILLTQQALYDDAETPGSRQHAMAWEFSSVTDSHGQMLTEASIRDGIVAWASVAHAHVKRYGTVIGEDQVQAAAWKAWGIALTILLRGDTGRLNPDTCLKLMGEIARISGVPSLLEATT